MAKMKTFQVLVEETRTHYLFVEARKPDGAKALVQTDEGWREATQYEEDMPMWFNPKTMRVVEVKEVT